MSVLTLSSLLAACSLLHQGARPAKPPARVTNAMMNGDSHHFRDLNLLIVEAYDDAGIERSALVGCSKASDIFATLLPTLAPDTFDCSITVVHPCRSSYTMPTVDELAAYDGVVWTGSSLTIHEDVPVVHRQIDLARRIFSAGVPQYGSCWGLQICAAAAGIPCEENPHGREHPIGRDITLTPEGRAHPMFTGKRGTFDALCAHTDHVASRWALSPAWPPRMEPGVSAHVLAGNAWSPVQALQVRVGSGEFWAVQYHPELELIDVARLMKTPATRTRLVDQGSFDSEEALVAYAAQLEEAHQAHEQAASAAENAGLCASWTEEDSAGATHAAALCARLGLNDDVLDSSYRTIELRNWMLHLVLPKHATRAREQQPSDGMPADAMAALFVPHAGVCVAPAARELRGGEVMASAAVEATTPGGTSTVDNPYTGDVSCAHVVPLTHAEAVQQVHAASEVQRAWAASTSVQQRVEMVGRFIDALEADAERIASEICSMMGKPLKQARGEVFGVRERAEAMMALAPSVLAPLPLPPKPNLSRRIEKLPVGVVLCIAPWNYPLLTAVNCIVPAVLAGNAVQIKHSSRTPLCGDAFERAFAAAGAPAGIVQALHVASGPVLDDVIAMPQVGFVSFTGSVSAGRKVYSTIAQSRFIDATLELGGKDGAYVARDADVAAAAAGVVDGAFYNAGQSCCAIERAYVHADVYDEFVAAAVELVNAYHLGDPTDAHTTMGPLALPSAPDFLRSQVEDALNKGARLLCGGVASSDAHGKGRFFLPTLLDECDHSMSLMVDESFGPVLGLMKVGSDEEAIELMNDSEFGLTAAVYTSDVERAERVARAVDAGTIFMNRCDYLDPYLAWTGAKDSGKGQSLSAHGFDSYTRLKSLNFKLEP